MKDILFLGPLYPPEREMEINEKATIKPSNAPNVYQWNLLSGMHELVGNALKVINVLPVGTWARSYRSFWLKENDWCSRGVKGHEIGCINLPFVKQWTRSQRTNKLLRKNANENTEIIIYSAYMPFLRAVYRLPDSIKITAIITDLPEYYDLGDTSGLKKHLRKYQTRMIYKYLERVNRFVILTEQMREPLHIGDRPYIRIEGICDASSQKVSSTAGTKKAIMYSGTLRYQYGIKNLLDAFKGIEDKDVELWICGSGEAEKEVKELAQKDSRVKFFGFCTQDEVAQLRSRAAILVNPRTNDGEYTKYSFPSKTMEYMVSGKPVVMYKLDGIPDEYDPYLNYVCSKGTPSEQIRKEILNILNNYHDAKDKAIVAEQFVRNNKNGVVATKKIIEFLMRK